MSNKINIFSNYYDITQEIRSYVEKNLIEYGYEITSEYSEDAEYNIVIGGDGTFIKAVHDSEFSEIPFIGINTGHLGFYNDVQHDKVAEALKKVINKEYTINNLRVIDCTINTDNEKYNFKSINEIVLKAKYTTALHFNLYVDDVMLETYAGDGVLFSTPSGSTAYNLSAGGAILYQSIDALQITPLAAIRSSLHRSLDKSLIVPKDTKIKLITKRREEANYSLGVDGIAKDVDKINYIDIQLSEKTIQKIVFDKNWFWKNIKEKFI